MFVAYQGDHEAVGARPAGPARAVDVVGVVGRRVEVDDQGHRIDVDPSRRDVGRDQHIEPTRTKGGERTLALALAAVAVDGGRLETGAAETLREPISAALGPAEHQCRPFRPDHVGGHRHPIDVFDPPEVVVHIAAILGGGRHLVEDRVVLVVADELVDWPVQGGREEKRLARVTRHVYEAANCGKEAHVRHAVGLVDDHHVHVGKPHGTLREQVSETPGARDDDVDAVAQSRALRAVTDAAVDRGHTSTYGGGQRRDDVLDLPGQLACRNEYERGGMTTLGTWAGSSGQA
jgi:hypothetical protein